jgi:hypothetical protein
VAEVFAGFVVGYALAMVVAPLGAIALVRSNDRSGFAQRFAPPGTNVVALTVVILFAAIIVLTGIGLVLGMALAGIEARRSEGGLGSPNLTYTLLVVSLAAVLAIPALAVPATRRYALVVALMFLIAFGWAVPWLATLG